MTPERWRKVDVIFQEAIELPAMKRDDFVLQACGGDHELRAEVQSLLAHEGEDSFLKVPIQGAAESLTKDVDARTGQRIGTYRITRLIGHGGMGAVYSAVRDDDQYQKQVALKLVKRGMDTDFVLNRFRHERQILATLEHPHIARLFDGGTTDDGLPYLVMEYIEGQTINAYCEAHQLSTPERLKLFVQVCTAVGYAHQKLVVHRDLKPSNIMVTREGVPKLLDFGIAKLLAPDLNPDTALRTATELRLMTPEYASPEQVRGVPVTTATDIYSLGVVLYELLTGMRPHRFKDYSPSDIERAICHTETEKPSTAVTRTTTAMPAKLRKQLSGDLDNIVLMAMRKETERRYNSVEQFAEDIRRHLEGRPVIARQDTFGYRAGKFVRRHKLGIAAAVLLISTLVAGMAATEYQARRAERRFQQVRKLANTFLFDIHDKIVNLQGSTEAREAVARTGLEYLDSLAQEAAGDPELQIELAEGYLRLAEVQAGYRRSGLEQFDQGMASYRKSLTLGQELLKRDPRNIPALHLMIRSHVFLADLQRARGDTPGSSATMEEAVRFVGSLESHPDLKQEELLTVINLYHFKGDIERELGQPQPALESYRRALHFDEQLSARFPGGRAQHSMSLDLSMVGDALADLGDLKAALDEYDKALKLRLENVQQHPDNAMFRRELALLYSWMGHYTGNPFRLNVGDRKKAEEYYREFRAIAEDLGRADPKNAQGQMDILFSYEHLANVLIATDPAQAAELYRKALVVLQPLLDKSPDELRYVRRQITQQRLLATSWQKLGDHRNALSTMRASLEKVQALMAKRPGNVALQGDLYDALMASSNLLLETGAREEASTQLRQAVALAEELARARPSDLFWQWRLAEVYSALGRYHGSQASWGEARTWQQKALDVWDNWNRRAVSSVFNTTRREDAVRALAQTDAALAGLKSTRD